MLKEQSTFSISSYRPPNWIIFLNVRIHGQLACQFFISPLERTHKAYVRIPNLTTMQSQLPQYTEVRRVAYFTIFNQRF
jgi:hypothetical protein